MRVVAAIFALCLSALAAFGSDGYFAQIVAGKVARVVVVPQAHLIDGETWTAQLLGGSWKQTYIDGSQRGKYAGVGDVFDSTATAFKTQQLSFIGDSITANMAAVQSSLGWPISSAQNLGVSGNTVAQILARLGSISASATTVILEAGTNDLVGLGTDANIIPGYTAMLNALASRPRVIVWGIPPCDEVQLEATHPGWSAYLNNAKIAQVNAQITALCATFSNCVAATQAMSMSFVGKTQDGIHPISTFYADVAAQILPSM